ncbi:MAG: hypothetical protein H3C49_08260 [Alphaproteobacteria bacterium]|nr:hypothetical protein [Alphaproteobacteria bacterium]
MPQNALHTAQTPPRNAAAPDAVMAALADFANAEMPVHGGFRFKALAPSTSLLEAPTYAVELYDDENMLAVTYKFNFFRDETAQGVLWRFFPLVIQWEGNSIRRKPGMDSAIIEHCLGGLRRFFAPDMAQGDTRLLMASGYLTTQRQGRAFFERMGWTLHSFEKKNGDYPALALQPEEIQKTARRIDDISMPFRTEETEASMLCFAVIAV